MELHKRVGGPHIYPFSSLSIQRSGFVEDTRRTNPAVCDSIMEKTNTPLSTLKDFCLTFAPGMITPVDEEKTGSEKDHDDEIASSHALDMLADIYAEEASSAAKEEAEREVSKSQAVKALNLLAERYDPIRANYWDWRKRAVLAV